MRVALLGNFTVPWCTECEWRRAFLSRGHVVTSLQEGDVRAVDVPDAARGHDLLVWVQTMSLAERGGTRDERRRMVGQLRAQGTPTLGLHLDRWWGLAREEQIATEPFFGVDLMCTADPGPSGAWEQAGVTHRWLPPAVDAGACLPGTFRAELASDVAFVGSWRGYHPEWPHRRELVPWLRRRFGVRFQAWPKDRPMRGQDLADLYASVKVVVGDSCLASPDCAYFSDRVPETVGRGGFLLHPWVDWAGCYEPGVHLDCWDAGDWDRLGALVERWYADDAGRAKMTDAGRAKVVAEHTYTVRVGQALDHMVDLGLLDVGDLCATTWEEGR